MKKYLFIIIILVFILSLSILGLYKYREQRDTSLSQIELVIDSSTENIAENTDTIPVEIDESQVEERQVENTEIETTPSTDKTEEITTEKISPPSSPSSTEIKQSTATTKKETTTKVSENTKQEEKTSTQTTFEVSKEEPKQEEKQETKQETKKEETTSKQEVVRCTTNDNHFMGVGNSGKWFSSKADAIKFYDDTLIYWDNWWQNTNSPEDDATYYANCPYGYEIWSCAYCSKWTINFYYR